MNSGAAKDWFVSPSLGAADDGPAYERKYLLDAARARQVEAWARRHLVPDPHGDPAAGGSYRTTSIYCDTAGLDVAHRTESFRRHKLRVRRYGNEPRVYLELKSKENDRVEKVRTAVPLQELTRLAAPTSSDDWAGHWFHHTVHSLGLRPTVCVTYRRTAFAGVCGNGTLRLTIDRQVIGRPAGDWNFAAAHEGMSLLADRAILELKFRTELPPLFNSLAAEIALTLSALSKYRLYHQMTGVVSASGGSIL